MNESIVSGENELPVTLILDHVEGLSDQLKKVITTEFEDVCSMLNFKELGHDIFRRWYIDGRVYHHLVINESQPKAGIQEIRPIDAAKSAFLPNFPCNSMSFFLAQLLLYVDGTKLL